MKIEQQSLVLLIGLHVLSFVSSCGESCDSELDALGEYSIQNCLKLEHQFFSDNSVRANVRRMWVSMSIHVSSHANDDADGHASGHDAAHDVADDDPNDDGSNGNQSQDVQVGNEKVEEDEKHGEEDGHEGVQKG